MADITITNITPKNSLTITNVEKPSNQTFDDMPVSFDSAGTPFSHGGLAIVKESKVNLTVNNVSKN